MLGERELLEQYVSSGKLMQLATLASDGNPTLCHVWYRVDFSPDNLYFISRDDRQHSINIRSHPAIAGGIVTVSLDQLGQPVRGVTFSGQARELPTEGIDQQIAAFIERWPLAADAIDATRLERRETSVRLYEISIDSWVLFDEHNFPAEPRRQVPAI